MIEPALLQSRPIRAVVAVCAVVGLGAGLSVRGAPAPNSLRLSRTSAEVQLTWLDGTGPYGVFRAVEPTAVVALPNLAGATSGTTFSEPLSALPGQLYFYLVDDAVACADDPECADADACDETEFCDTGAGFCQVGPPPACDDTDLCTTDSCDMVAGCLNVPVDCGDGDACTADACSPADGSCTNQPLDCSDGDACTTDVCSAGSCSNPPLDCNDLSACTLDSCIPASGCHHELDPAVTLGLRAELAGNALAQYPFFEYVRAFNQDGSVEVAIDPTRYASIVGQTCDVYVVAGRTAVEWCVDAGLTDVRGAPDTRAFTGSNIQGNTFPLAAPFQLDADAGPGLGVGYDVVLDCDRNGELDPADFIDGLGPEAGFYAVHDLTSPGPLATNGFDSVGPEPDWCQFFPAGGPDDMRVYYPASLDDPGFTGSFPLVMISHGNGHCYDWYDFLGQHLASYGFIVVAHDNRTVPGIETASTTTLEFTDRVLAEQSTLGEGAQDGVLGGHIDSSRITWIGHSRGGEGVARAYDRLRDENYVPPNASYTVDDIVLLSSIAPTDFLGPTVSNPHDVPYHLLYGSSDGDICGCPDNEVTDAFNLFERASGARQSTYVHGADHNDFNCCGFNDFSGPPGTELGRAEAQRVQKAVYLALLERFVKGSVPAKDYLWRQSESLRPIGVASTTVVNHEYREAPSDRGLVVDDYQTGPGKFVSSSGTPVSLSVDNVNEDQLDDGDASFEWRQGDPMNGMTRGRSADDTRGVVFRYSADSFYEVEIPTGQRDLAAFQYLSLRVAQGTRHPNTVAVLDDLTFTVTLRDGSGGSSSIHIGAYGGGVEEPYQRTGFGDGVGWQNEFETIRIRLTDFLTNGAGLDFGDVETIRLDLGPSWGSPEGRLGLDDIELTLD